MKAEHVVNCGGLWAREVGRMVGVELPVLAMEHMYLLTEPMPEVEAFNKATGREMIGVLDFKGEIYTRQERNGILLGTYEKACKPWSPVNTPWDFGHELLPPDLDRIAPSLEVGFRHFPGIEKAGIKQVVNGPFTFAPDGNPLVGPVQGLTNFWVACGVMAGFSQGGGVGLALSNWMVNGDPGFDVWGMDVARWGEWASLRYTNAKVRENYSRRFSIRFPNEELPAARPAQTTPLYDTMVAQNATMGDSWGLETPLWFAPKGTEPKDVVSFHRSNDFEHVGNEVRAVRAGVGVTEIANFAKYEVSGAGAEDFLNRLMTNRMPKKGRIVLTPMLNEFGRLIGDFTIAKTGDEKFMIWGSSAAQKYHMRWFEKHLPGMVRCASIASTRRWSACRSPGRKARRCWQSWSTRMSRPKAFRFMDFREMAVGGAPCMVNRITYTGDLGYEIWMQPAYQRLVYHAIKEAGAEFGIVDFGMRALLSMRLEKNFPTWFRELRPIYGPFEGAHGPLHQDGEERLHRPRRRRQGTGGRPETAPRLDGGRRGRCRRDGRRADLGQGRTARITARSRSRTATARRASTRSGKEVRGSKAATGASAVRGITDGEWRVVGWVTSGGFAHHVGKSLAQGYVPAPLAENESAGLFEIEILGHRRAGAHQCRAAVRSDRREDAVLTHLDA